MCILSHVKYKISSKVKEQLVLCESEMAEESKSDKEWVTKKDTVSCLHAIVVLYFYILSFSLSTVVESQFHIDKVCMANFRYNKNLCDNLTSDSHIKEEVKIQKYLAIFHVYSTYVRKVLPILPGFLMAAWSDAHGPCAPIHIGMSGKTMFFLGYTLVAHYFLQWPLEYVLLVAALPRALAGYDIGFYMAIRSYVSEVTPPEFLTQRLATMEMVNHIAQPIGLAIGSALFTTTQRDYVVSFLVSTAVATFGLSYGAIFVKNFKRERSKKMVSCEEFHNIDKIRNICFNTAFKHNKSLYILIIIMFLHSMMDDMSLFFLYTQFKFHWDTNIYTAFQIADSVSGVIVSALVSSILSKTAISDLGVMGTGAIMIIVSRLIYAITNVQWVLYLGAIASSFRILIYISVYSMVSKITDIANRGKFFVIFTSIESATGVVASELYSYVYTATVETYPSAVFYISVILQCLILGLILILKYIHVTK